MMIIGSSRRNNKAALTNAYRSRDMEEKVSYRRLQTTISAMILSSEIIRFRPIVPAVIRWLYFHAKLS